MKLMKKRILSLALAISMIFAFSIPALAAPAPKQGDPMWNDAYKGIGYEAPRTTSARTSADGDKISSNAHSGDVPGLYFYWDDNNKSTLDATLLVDKSFFELVKGEVGSRSFTITAKNSNAYWDYKIEEGKGIVVSSVSEDVSAYKIPRYFMYKDKNNKDVKDELKNINMIFISGDWKDAEVNIEKIWLDEEGCVFAGDNSLVSLNSPFVLGDNNVAVKSVFGTNYTIKESAIGGFTTLKNSITVTVKPGESKTITFVNQKQYANIKIVKVWFDIDGNVITDMAILNNLSASFAIDDAIAVLGLNQVKEGTYLVSETGCVNGYSLVGNNNIEVTVKPGECAVVTFYNMLEVEKFDYHGNIELVKYVDSVEITVWIESVYGNDYDINKLIECFNLYSVDADGAQIDGLSPMDSCAINSDGVIRFENLADGWYAIEEVLTAEGSLVFEQAPVMYVLIANGITFTSTKIDFDYDAFYTIVNGYGNGYVLGYPGLNNTGDIFPIGVHNTTTGVVYPSFCANAGSRAFAGQSGLDCSGYMVTERMDRDTAAYKDFLLAYNYIEANYGNLDEYRAVTQIVTWILLGAIDTTSDNFDNINWDAVAAGTSVVNGIQDAKSIVLDVMDNYKDFKGAEKIVDVVFMVCEHNHDYADCQPQLVPIYGEDDNIFNNKTKQPDTRLFGNLQLVVEVDATHKEITKEPAKATNGANTLVSKLNFDYSDIYKAPQSGQVCVLLTDGAYTAEGQMVEVADSSPNNIGTGYFYNIKVVNGQIVVTFPNLVSAHVGIAASDKPVFANGMPDFKATLSATNNTLSIPLPTGDEVYLYMHIAGGITWISGWNEVSSESIQDEYTGEVSIVIQDAAGNIVFEGTVNLDEVKLISNLEPGEYTYTISGDDFDDVEGTVTVVGNGTAEIYEKIMVTGEDVIITLS